MKKFVLATFLALLVIVISSHALAEENGYVFRLSETAITLFSENENVTHLGGGVYLAKDLESVYEFAPESMIEAVIPNVEFQLFDTDYPQVTSDTKFSSQWNLTEIYAEAARKKGLSGKGVRIAIIDSGIDSSHPDLDNSKFDTGYNCIEDDDDEYNTTDVYGHGTNVCGIISAIPDNETDIAGIAPNATIIPLKVTDGQGISAASLYGGIYMAMELDCDIINMSLGGSFSDPRVKAELKYWINQAAAKGIIIIAAAGNDGTTTINYPAGFDNVIGVGSVKKDLTLSQYSQKNESVFVVAPGHSVTTLTMGSGTSSVIGTSIATPHITAIVALIKEVRPNATLEDVKMILRESATNLGDDEGYDTNFGYGLVNIEKIMKELEDDIPEMIISDGIKNGVPRIHVHNNSSDISDAVAYLVSYGENSVSNVSSFRYAPQNYGVTTYSSGNNFESFLLWDAKLMPYIKKYNLKQ